MRAQHYKVQFHASSRSKRDFLRKGEARERAPVAFAKMYAASDMQLIFGAPAKPPALRGEEERRSE